MDTLQVCQNNVGRLLVGGKSNGRHDKTNREGRIVPPNIAKRVYDFDYAGVSKIHSSVNLFDRQCMRVLPFAVINNEVMGQAEHLIQIAAIGGGCSLMKKAEHSSSALSDGLSSNNIAHVFIVRWHMWTVA